MTELRQRAFVYFLKKLPERAIGLKNRRQLLLPGYFARKKMPLAKCSPNLSLSMETTEEDHVISYIY